MSALIMEEGRPMVDVDGKLLPTIEHMEKAIEKAIYLANLEGAVTVFDTFSIVPKDAVIQTPTPTTKQC